jgi:hypothetical protein
MPVQATEIVESQEAAGIDRDPHVPSIDLLGELGQSVVIDRVIRPHCAHSIARPDNLRVTERRPRQDGTRP